MSNRYYNEGLTLGELIDKLKALSGEANIEFDFGAANITALGSYRGYYDQLALGYEGEYGTKMMTVGELLKDCEEAVGKTYQGWKGGDYRMDRDTNIFVANSGCTSNTYLVDVVRKYDDWYVLTTKTDIEGDY